MGRNIIIVGDVHGRSFWKKDVQGKVQNDKIVFLGDYLDPYPREGISDDVAWENFMEIFELKKTYPDNVELLLGNHDLAYLFDELIASRYDVKHCKRNRDFFQKNAGYFQMTAQTSSGKKKVLFSHAGITRGWLKSINLSPDNLSLDHFNDIWLDEDLRERYLPLLLDSISYYRGGGDVCGSMVWCDIREWLDSGNWWGDDIIQVFGHTQRNNPVCIDGRYYCLDCKRCFILDESDGHSCHISEMTSAEIQT